MISIFLPDETKTRSCHYQGNAEGNGPIVMNIFNLSYLLANQVKILTKPLIFKYEVEEEISAEETNMGAILKST